MSSARRVAARLRASSSRRALSTAPASLAAIHPEMTAWRHDFHMHPELGFEETRTSGVVADLKSESELGS